MRNKLKTFIGLSLIGLVLSAALWLDLRQRGIIWGVFWNLTGESEPAQQLLGFSQYVASQARIKPRTAAHVEVQNIPQNPFGVNSFLQLEVLPESRLQQLQLLDAAGFGWIRQEFPWEDIEIHGRGDFTDRRNLEAVGEISAWEKYDNIVDLVDQFPNIQMIVRLSNPPQWAQPENWTAEGPPSDLQDFVNFAVTVAERYKGRQRYYQIWNEPNLYPEWGEQQINPEAYAEMLCRVHDALKAVDPEILILTAAIGPTTNLSGRDAYDLLYLQRLYDAGISDCFDILSAQGYGLFSGPTDRRQRTTLMNFARHVWYRDIMVANGDAHKPIWISEAGWNPVPPSEVIPNMDGRENFGVVSEQEAAEYIPMAYERALREWPWVGTISYWYLKRPHDLEREQNWYSFRILEHDFSPTPMYDSFKAMIQGGEWQTWRADPLGAWIYKARARTPQVLVGLWALGLIVAVVWREYRQEK